MTKLPQRVLVADSDYDFARRLRAELEARGHAVEIVSDGLSAINMIKTRHFDGAVVDVELVSVDGLQVLAAIGNLGRSMPVVMTSRRAGANLDREARKAGARAYVAKPVAPTQVAEAVLHEIGEGWSSSPRKRLPLALSSLEPGQALLMECRSGPLEGKLTSRLLASHPASLAAAAPTREGRTVALAFGTRVTVGFPMPDGWYQFETYVLGATSYGGEAAVLLAQPKLVTHIQRRRYARTRASFDVELEEEHAILVGRGQDACEGGMRVMTENALPVGSQMRCRIQSGTPEQAIVLSGTVIWAQEVRDNGHRYRAGIQFAAPIGIERERLRAWVEGLGRGDDRPGASPSPLTPSPPIVT
jgi:CheY-like chemotaxis protein